ncbi:MAG: SIMPL domain-containing protein [Thermonema sp.]|uniref:SIMPL domain-containing protein n=1 Tax=Thermonema sp. TaxID=2231181 RepID=UPI0021DF0FD8|nr:SIMPL domain-containing protein [Thermonema sp.]GIV39833.1 MAG: SIMPL domain-containing protein [Thermonema sp.]
MRYLPPALAIGVAAVVSALILSYTYLNRYAYQDTIEVIGLGSKDFKSDLIVWRASFSRKAPTIKEAYALLDEDRALVMAFLQEQAVKKEEFVFSPIAISKDFVYSYDDRGRQYSTFNGYVLSQTLTIESKRVDAVEDIMRNITGLIQRGLEVVSYEPEYYYTKLSELKIQMIAEATKDARLRAEKIAQEAGASLGKLKGARMGVFQITAQNSNEDYSWGGAFNTSSKMKTASITMRLTFEVD